MRTSANKIYFKAPQMAVFIVLSLLLCRISHGGFTLAIAAFGAFCALSGRIGPAICTFVFLPMCVNVNPILVPKAGMMWSYGLRFGPLLIGLCLMLGATRRRGDHRLPFGGILPFLGCALISSAVGYVPQISYLKMINYFIFLIGIWLGTQNIQWNPRDVEMIRAFFLGMIFLLVWGSLAMIPFPAISYATSLRGMAEFASVDELNAIGREMLATTDGKTLFCGLLNHSQSLSPILALSMGWLVCDMLFVEKRLRLFHALTIVAMLPMLYMTRSRVALLTGASALAIIYFYTVNRIQIDPQIKSRLRTGMRGFCLLAAAMAGISEARDQTITKWIRKTNDIASDERGAAEAFTLSRQGLMEESMYDFRRNPLFGSGFQVDWRHQELWRRSNGLILSASIEKGVLPVMVLGETGICGAITFGFFLLSFYATCGKRHLYVTATMFTLLIISNMGEASFFSPGGMGGVLWQLTVLGGFIIDTMVIYGGDGGRR